MGHVPAPVGSNPDNVALQFFAARKTGRVAAIARQQYGLAALQRDRDERGAPWIPRLNLGHHLQVPVEAWKMLHQHWDVCEAGCRVDDAFRLVTR